MRLSHKKPQELSHDDMALEDINTISYLINRMSGEPSG